MICILYVTLVGALLGIAGLLVERALPPGYPRRWIWCAVIPLSVFLPGYYRFHHNASVIDTDPLTVLDPTWWIRLDSYDGLIERAWLTASVLLIVLAIGNAFRVWYLLRSSHSNRSGTATATVDGVPIVVTDSLGPATVGVWHSRVLVPRWVLTLPRTDRRYVLRHEDEHRKAHDARLLFVASLTLILMPWNAALWWNLRRLRLAVEMDCDNRVVNGLGDANAYGHMLLKVAQATSRGPRLQPALLGGVGMLEHRLTVLLAPTPLRHIQKFLLPAFAIALLLLVFSMPHPVLGNTTTSHSTMTHTAQQ
jgi:bla regulator protein BlaR1